MKALEESNRISPSAASTISRGSNSHYKSNGVEKVAYNSMREAQEQARRLEIKEQASMRAYQCLECRLWHVGHAKDYERPGLPMMPVRPQTINATAQPPATANSRMSEVTANLQRIIRQIESREVEIKRSMEEATRLAALSTSLFDQSVEAEQQSKTLKHEAQSGQAQVLGMKAQAQTAMHELNQAFGKL